MRKSKIGGRRSPSWGSGLLAAALVGLTAAAGLVIFLIGLLRGTGPLQILRVALATAVAAVPDGLPMVATSTLALGVAAMRRRRVLVRRPFQRVLELGIH